MIHDMLKNGMVMKQGDNFSLNDQTGPLVHRVPRCETDQQLLSPLRNPGISRTWLKPLFHTGQIEGVSCNPRIAGDLFDKSLVTSLSIKGILN